MPEKIPCPFELICVHLHEYNHIFVCASLPIFGSSQISLNCMVKNIMVEISSSWLLHIFGLENLEYAYVWYLRGYVLSPNHCHVRCNFLVSNASYIKSLGTPSTLLSWKIEMVCSKVVLRQALSRTGHRRPWYEATEPKLFPDAFPPHV